MSNTLKYNGNLNILGNIIKNYRVKNNLSLEKLSNKLQLYGINLPATSIHKIETNKRSIKDYELAGLSEVLDFSIDEVLKDFKNSIQ